MPDSIIRQTELPERSRLRDEPVAEFLTFAVNKETFGIGLTQVLEILGDCIITSVPRAPRDILGVCTVRGELVTVVDAAQRLQANAPVSDGRGWILLTSNASGEKVGLLVHEVTGVKRFNESEMESTASSLVADISSHVESIGRKGAEVTVLVNLSSLIGDRREEAK